MNTHQITKRELIEMLAPFDDNDRIAVIAKDMLVNAEVKLDGDDKPTMETEEERGSLTLLLGQAKRANHHGDTRTAIIIEAYEA